MRAVKSINARKYNAKFCYPDSCLNQDMIRIRNIWERVQASRDRNAIYDYLDAVFELIKWWNAEGRTAYRTKRALSINGLFVPEQPEPYSAIIAASVSPGRLDKRLINKYSRVLRFAAAFKDPDKRLDKFIKKHGGLNRCAGEFSRRLARRSATDKV